jgi:hypothetical protein
MNHDDDWFNGLAGRERDGPESEAAREARLLRAAILRSAQAHAAEGIEPDRQALLDAAQRAGMFEPAAWWRCAGCAHRWHLLRERAGRRWAWGGLASGAAALLLALLLPPMLRDAADEGDVLRRAPADRLWLIVDPQPQPSRDALADQLAADGVHVRRYEQLGRYGLQLELPAEPGEATQRALTALGITVVPGLALRIEFRLPVQ